MGYNCEHCKTFNRGEPAHKETHPGHRETITLVFCEDCVE